MVVVFKAIAFIAIETNFTIGFRVNKPFFGLVASDRMAVGTACFVTCFDHGHFTCILYPSNVIAFEFFSIIF